MRSAHLWHFIVSLAAPACFYQPTGSSDGSSTAVPATSTSATVDAVTSSTTQSLTTATSTTATSSDTSTTSLATSTTDASSSSTAAPTTGASTTDATTLDASTTDSTSGSSSSGGPMCGDNMVEGEEVCDGTDLGGQSCAKLLPSKWGGGQLKCSAGCMSFDDTSCCIGVGQKCDPLFPEKGACCAGLTCKLSKCEI